jgi:hypothetical protein
MFGAFVSRIKRKSLIIFLFHTWYCFCIHFYVTIYMKLDPGMHIGLHLVFFGKSGVTCSLTFMFSRDIYVPEFCLKSTSKQTSGKGTDNAHNTMLKIAKLHQNYWIQDKNDRRLNWGPSITIMVEKLVTTMLGAYLHCRNPNRFYFSCSCMTPDPRIILLYLHVHVTVGLVQKYCS